MRDSEKLKMQIGISAGVFAILLALVLAIRAYQ